MGSILVSQIKNNYFKIGVVYFRQGILWVEFQYNSRKKRYGQEAAKKD